MTGLEERHRGPQQGIRDLRCSRSWTDPAVGACSFQARSEAESGLIPLNEWRRQAEEVLAHPAGMMKADGLGAEWWKTTGTSAAATDFPQRDAGR